MKLARKVAIVTGASSGIGRAIAQRFAAEGAIVTIADVRRNPIEGGRPTDELILEMGGEAVFECVDVAEWNQIDALVNNVVCHHGSLDILVNNAAIDPGLSLLDTSEEDWDRVMAVNLKGVFLGCKRAVQQMLKQELHAETRGRIVNISSQHGMVAAPADVAYGVSKAGVAHLTRQVAADYAKHHIICNAVAPGKIVTGRGGRSAEPEGIEYSKRRTPMTRLGHPNDVANAALFLASDEATYLTGVNLLVDGGWMAS